MAVIPNSNVNLATNIRDVLNAHGSSCTNDVISFFDSRAVINQWSFRKPYSSDDDMFKLSDSQIRSINCGFTPKQIAAYTNLPNTMDGNMNGWVYTRPSGGQYSPYRLGDYVGYDTDAPPMIQGFNVPSEVPKQGTTTVDATAVVTTSTGTNVTIADIGGLKDYKPAVYLVSGSYSRMYESSSSIASGGFSVPINIADMTQGDWVVYPFLKSGSTYYTIPNVESKIMKITASSFSVSLTATRASNAQTISWTLTIKNNGSAVTWKNNNWTLTSRTAPSNSMSGAIGDISVKANATTTVTGSITNVNDALWNSMMLTLSMTLNSGNNTASVPVLSQNMEMA
jgi:hypothetical protein